MFAPKAKKGRKRKGYKQERKRYADGGILEKKKNTFIYSKECETISLPLVSKETKRKMTKKKKGIQKINQFHLLPRNAPPRIFASFSTRQQSKKVFFFTRFYPLKNLGANEAKEKRNDDVIRSFFLFPLGHNGACLLLSLPPLSLLSFP